MNESKSIPISKQMVWNAYQKVRANGGSAGVDRQSIEDFEQNLSDNLFKLWNRLASGSYFPPAVKEVEIPKANGKVRKLGIPTVSDRVAQMVIKDYLEPTIDPLFHPNSFGYRPGRSAHHALDQAKRNCWDLDWVVDLDIQSFFDEIDHDMLLKALQKHTTEKWVLMYVKRWLTVPVEQNGEQIARVKGTPQGGVISPLLANLFLHYAFDKWMQSRYPEVRFERYADDIILHFRTQKEAGFILNRIKERLNACKLKAHPEKTKIIYCRDQKRNKSDHAVVSFNFLGYTFKARQVRNKTTQHIFYSFTPAISKEARVKINNAIKARNIRRRINESLETFAQEMNPQIRGWIAYYGKHRKSEMGKVFFRLNKRISNWIRDKHKIGIREAVEKHKALAKANPKLFAHWEHGYRP